jgi:hypothetical protein
VKKAIIIIQSKNGEHKSSIIRTISQILIGLSDETVVNVGELGLSENITSVVEIGKLRIGVATQNDKKNNIIKMIKDLTLKDCDFILCATQYSEESAERIEVFAFENGFKVTTLKSFWSDKLEVNYLTEVQIDRIVNELKRLQLN